VAEIIKEAIKNIDRKEIIWKNIGQMKQFPLKID
jgi:hypothetical protein